MSITFAQKEEDTSAEGIKIPADFFDNMFRNPSEDFLVAWHGGVKIVKVPFPDSRNETPVSIAPLVNFLNRGHNEIFDRYFVLNMKDEKQQLVSPNGAIWSARCGLKAENNINISLITGKEIKAFPPDILADVWSKSYTIKKSHKDLKTKKAVVEIFRIEATSIYYYDLKKKDLKGKIERGDDYKLCGEVLFQRIGPGAKGKIHEHADVANGEYNFKEQLTRGDYLVFYEWPNGNRILLDEDFVYNPTNKKMVPDFKIQSFEGDIDGKVVYKESDVPAKDYPVKLVPVCPESGLPEHETTTDEKGEYTFKDIPHGEYYVVVEGAKDTDAFLTNPRNTNIKPADSEITFKYDIYATYTASGFAKAKLVWRNTTIRFPSSDKEIQFFDMVAFRNSGNYDNPTGTDGKPLQIPYTTIIPGIGKQTLYGWPENESAIPEVISVRSLGGKGVFAAFKVSLDEDALNTCNISQNNNGPIYLDLNFDLTGRYPNSTVWQQVDVGCKEDKEWNITKGNSLNGYPLAFKQLKFTEAEIEKFKNAEEFERTLSNGGASLLIEFKLSEENN
ncbi:hypothetical protein [Lutibacter sp.]